MLLTPLQKVNHFLWVQWELRPVSTKKTEVQRSNQPARKGFSAGRTSFSRPAEGPSLALGSGPKMDGHSMPAKNWARARFQGDPWTTDKPQRQYAFCQLVQAFTHQIFYWPSAFPCFGHHYTGRCKHHAKTSGSGFETLEAVFGLGRSRFGSKYPPRVSLCNLCKHGFELGGK